MPAKGFHHRGHGSHREQQETSVTSVVNSFPFACFKHDAFLALFVLK
jgi:hypothetical protein